MRTRNKILKIINKNPGILFKDLSNTMILTKSTIFFHLKNLENDGIKNNYIQEKYGKYGTQNLNGMPSLSLPLK